MKKTLIFFIALVCLLFMAAAHPPPPFHNDSLWRIYDNNDVTKRLRFEANSISTGTTRTITMPDADVDLAIGALTPTNSYFIVGNGSAFVTESGDTAKHSLGLGTADSPNFEDVIVRRDFKLTGGLDSDIIFYDGEVWKASIEWDNVGGLGLRITSDSGLINFDNEHLKTTGNLTDGTNSLSIAEAKAAHTHVSNNGSDHSYIGQDVTATGTPTFTSITVPTGRSATFIVAPNNAPQTVKNQADYLCDGTADNVQIQAALDALPAIGGKVSLAAGTFTLADAISVPSLTTLSGVGFSTKLDANDIATKSVIVNSDVGGGNTKIEISNLQIYQGGNQGSANAHGAIDIRNTTFVNLHDLYFDSSFSDGILLIFGVEWANVSNIFMYNVQRHGIFVGHNCAYITISNIISYHPQLEHVCLETYMGDANDWNYHISVSNCVGFNSKNFAYYTEHCKYVTWSNCIANTTPNQPMFYCKDSYNVAYTNCIARDGGTYGFQILPDVWDVSIDNCQTYNTADIGFLLEGVRVSMTNCRTTECVVPWKIQAITAGTYKRDTITIANCQFHNATGFCQIRGNNVIVSGNQWTESEDKGNSRVIDQGGYANDKIMILNNIFETATSTAVLTNYGSVTNFEVSGNIGLITEKRGTATLSNGQTTEVVNHGLNVTPTSVVVSPVETWGAATKFWADTITSSQFTIHVDQDPGADVDFNWQAKKDF